MMKICAFVLLAVGLAAAREVNEDGIDLIKKFEPFHADFFVTPNVSNKLNDNFLKPHHKN